MPHPVSTVSTTPPLPSWTCLNRSHASAPLTTRLSYLPHHADHTLNLHILNSSFSILLGLVTSHIKNYSHRDPSTSQGLLGSEDVTNWDSSVPQAAPTEGQGEGTCMALAGFHSGA
ncbi:hypothetical protein PILCRDRAFT_623308 [Piloderma croceum F 1598]|uniref:Uncharacterized protein n=1 Tax=Piloderma croceum (strain F 1598) TaxID=765440 RepID=A0A0C3EXT4_PILCF|nr:hypothetical protein PILCRDRAFT_623308 [Piloderma croceum F 1598]